jgi:hypothetical protein
MKKLGELLGSPFSSFAIFCSGFFAFFAFLAAKRRLARDRSTDIMLTSKRLCRSGARHRIDGPKTLTVLVGVRRRVGHRLCAGYPVEVP